MKTLKSITDKHETLYKAAKALNIHQQQLTRWLDNDALIDESGFIFIKTKGQIKEVKK